MTNRQHKRSRAILFRLNSLMSFAENLMLMIAAICVLAILLVTAVDVFYRYALNQALGWAYDTVLVLMLGLVFLSIASIQAAHAHVAVTALEKVLPIATRAPLACLRFIVGAFCFFLIGWKNVEYAIEAAGSGWVYGGFGAIPTWLPYGVIGIGSFLMAVRMVEQLLTVIYNGTDSLQLAELTITEKA